jgi:small subunit ribosomal protein S1
MTQIIKTKETNDNDDFAALLEQSISVRDNFRSGDKVIGTIVGITKDIVFVDISGKSEAIIPGEEFRDKEGNCTIKTGDKITAYVIASGASGIELTTCIGRGNVNPTILKIAKDEEIPVEGIIQSKVNGGFIIMIDGIRAFCPVSQIDRKYSGNDSDYLNKRYNFSIIELKGKDVIVSRRSLLEKNQRDAEENLKGKLNPGDTITGTITRIAEFGVFVDIGGIVGLVPRAELSRSRLITPENFAIGSTIAVKIISIDWETKKFSLSIKETEEDPWSAFTYSEGSEVNGIVTNTIKGGAFVELSPGIEGFIPISKMSHTRRINNVEDVINRGDHVAVIISSIAVKDRKISLELMTGEVDPWTSDDSGLLSAILEGTVEEIKTNGLVIRLTNGMDGFLPKREISCDKNADITKLFKIHDSIKVVAKDINKSEKRMIFSQREIEKREERESMKQYLKKDLSIDETSSLGSQYKTMFDALKKKME